MVIVSSGEWRGMILNCIWWCNLSSVRYHFFIIIHKIFLSPCGCLTYLLVSHLRVCSKIIRIGKEYLNQNNCGKTNDFYYYWSLSDTWKHINAWKLLVLDKISWNHIIVRKTIFGNCFFKTYTIIQLADRSREHLEGSLFSSFYIKVYRRELLLSLDCFTFPWYIPCNAEC